MNIDHIDDPRLTAYALGELSGRDQADIEELLARSPDARAALDEIRVTTELLSSELTAEISAEMGPGAAGDAGLADRGPATPALTADQRSAVLDAAADPTTRRVAPAGGVVIRPWFRAAVAATLMVCVAWWITESAPVGGRPGPAIGGPVPTAGDDGGFSDFAKRPGERSLAGVDVKKAAGTELAAASRDRRAGGDTRGDAAFGRVEDKLAEGDGTLYRFEADGVARGKRVDGGNGPVGAAGPSHANDGGGDDSVAELIVVVPQSTAGQVENLLAESDSLSTTLDGPSENFHLGFQGGAEAPTDPAAPAREQAQSAWENQAEADSPEMIARLAAVGYAGEAGRKNTTGKDAETQALDDGTLEVLQQMGYVDELVELEQNALSVLEEAPADAAGGLVGKAISPRAPASAPEPTAAAPATAGAPTVAVAQGDVALRDLEVGAELLVARGREAAGAARNFGIAPVTETEPEVTDLAIIADRIDRDGFDAFERTQPKQAFDESYAAIWDNPFTSPWDQPLSTFGVDVDSGAYANVRRFLNNGQLPPPDAVRIEELVNFFDFDYTAPDAREDAAPFAVNVETSACPWEPKHRLLRVGLKGAVVDPADRPAANLVFLLDVSGSMKDADKLPLLKQSMRLLVAALDARDRVAIVTYAGEAGVALPSTGCDQKSVILSAIERLGAGGSTNGAAGIRTAYDIAHDAFRPDGINRVILGSDGDFNVGVSDTDELVQLITQMAGSGVFLSVLGFGEGNLKDEKLESIANRGNGHYSYIDSLDEGRRVLVENLAGTLQTIAKDVKVQVDFNPGFVGAYRLIGYENRVMAAQDFANDRKDAGEIGAGHSVTALYEIAPPGDTPLGNNSKYVAVAAEADDRIVDSTELLTVNLRYKQPTESRSTLMSFPIAASAAGAGQGSDDQRFAAAVAAFGMLLRNSQHAGAADFDLVLELAHNGRGADPTGYRAEFVRLVALARDLRGGR